MEGNGVEVQVERCPPSQAQATDGVEPVAHQRGIAGRRDPATVFGQERSLGDDVQAGEERQPFVEHRAHDVGMAGIAEELQGQERPHGAGGGDIFEPGKPHRARRMSKSAATSQGRNRNSPPNWCGAGAVSGPAGERRRSRRRRAGAVRVAPRRSSRQLGEPLFLEDRGDRRRAERSPSRAKRG